LFKSGSSLLLCKMQESRKLQIESFSLRKEISKVVVTNSLNTLALLLEVPNQEYLDMGSQARNSVVLWNKGEILSDFVFAKCELGSSMILH